MELKRQGEQVESLKADFYHRSEAIVGGAQATAYPVNNETLSAGSVFTSDDLRGANGVPSVAVGVWGMLYGNAGTVGASLFIGSADGTPDEYSPRVDFWQADFNSGLVMVELGTGANAGKVSIKAFAGDITDIYFWPVGWWK